MNEPTAAPEQVTWQRDDYSNIQTPFDGDDWDRLQFARHLTGYVQRLRVGATIAIDAEWGMGKTWFVQHWKQHLINEGHAAAYLDAFANDYIDDPFLLIATEIANLIETQLKNTEKPIKKTAVSVYHAMLPSLPKLVFSAMMPLKDATGHFSEDLTGEMNNRIKEQLEEKVKNHEADKQILENFKKQLAAVASKLDKPLVFIIDELDRCKPEFSIRLIERIKHFFDTPNIVFVLAIHKKQLCESIDSYYGFKTPNQYLEKFIDFSLKIPDTKSYTLNYSKSVFENLTKLGLIDTNYFELNILIPTCIFLCSITNPTPRQLKSILNKFSLLCFSEENINKNHMLLMCLFLKESGAQDKILNFSFSDTTINRIIDTKNMSPVNFEFPNLESSIYAVLSRDKIKFGISPNLSKLLAAFSTRVIFSSPKEAESMRKNFARIIKPNKSTHEYQEHGQDWLEYIQHGMTS